ncbi:hypothetical protein BCV72DRAFT_304344 [Rhizopus microsporus var. microsporus]|uniref:Uncharacterized protein n=2 Tax=Rhizopus microsporus TaxID=58291 RepID=A0A2G4SL05_RHIZD|nr:uncharacterized protein RHIMIDRAFT_240559 [Rhizopus microsporus ATCC 52813]ORE07714.1 hypothetical protein BCV72DRAFT_304344 [Rhizopus microsporus var. microsporus]PHZ09443.1 hypothetical protein RHIMIDRAFT_240559 [Rhizopus microsporus ATCC 52813]
MSEANPLQFSTPKDVVETSLFSFHPLFYLYFMLSFFFVPYPFYRWIATRYKWELNTKSIARHCSDIMLGMNYGLILFTFGNYTHTFSWITVVAFYPSLFGYGLLAELPFAKQSLPNIKHWPKGMWVIFLTALGVILAFAGVHIYFASQLEMPFVVYYVCSLLIPIFFFATAILLKKEVNQNWLRTFYVTRISRRQRLDTEDSQPKNDTIPSPYAHTISIHLHHWQIFYVLAFFTRFTHPVSQVAAGIVIACYMQGICAYGYDHLVNDNM